MIRTAMLTVALAFPAAALACGGEAPQTADVANAPQVQLAAAHADATKCADKAALVGSSCRYSTGQMAQRVHADGKDTALTAQLVRQDKQLDSHVAAPFTVNDEMYVIANEVVAQIGDTSASMALNGKVLEVDGVKYFLVTGFEKAAS